MLFRSVEVLHLAFGPFGRSPILVLGLAFPLLLICDHIPHFFDKVGVGHLVLELHVLAQNVAALALPQDRKSVV